MLDDILKDTWVYKEIIKEGKEEGKEKGRKEELCTILIRITTLRFPNLVNQAQKQAEQAKSTEQLRTMIDKLVIANTDQEARHAFTVNE